jgi:hypothetical protein
MTTCRFDVAGTIGFLAFSKDGALRLVRPGATYAACCRADQRFARAGL